MSYPYRKPPPRMGQRKQTIEEMAQPLRPTTRSILPPHSDGEGYSSWNVKDFAILKDIEGDNLESQNIDYDFETDRILIPEKDPRDEQLRRQQQINQLQDFLLDPSDFSPDEYRRLSEQYAYAWQEQKFHDRSFRTNADQHSQLCVNDILVHVMKYLPVSVNTLNSCVLVSRAWRERVSHLPQWTILTKMQKDLGRKQVPIDLYTLDGIASGEEPLPRAIRADPPPRIYHVLNNRDEFLEAALPESFDNDFRERFKTNVTKMKLYLKWWRLENQKTIIRLLYILFEWLFVVVALPILLRYVVDRMIPSTTSLAAHGGDDSTAALIKLQNRVAGHEGNPFGALVSIALGFTATVVILSSIAGCVIFDSKTIQFSNRFAWTGSKAAIKTSKKTTFQFLASAIPMAILRWMILAFLACAMYRARALEVASEQPVLDIDHFFNLSSSSASRGSDLSIPKVFENSALPYVVSWSPALLLSANVSISFGKDILRHVQTQEPKGLILRNISFCTSSTTSTSATNNTASPSSCFTLRLDQRNQESCPTGQAALAGFEILTGGRGVKPASKPEVKAGGPAEKVTLRTQLGIVGFGFWEQEHATTSSYYTPFTTDDEDDGEDDDDKQESLSFPSLSPCHIIDIQGEQESAAPNPTQPFVEQSLDDALTVSSTSFWLGVILLGCVQSVRAFVNFLMVFAPRWQRLRDHKNLYRETRNDRHQNGHFRINITGRRQSYHPMDESTDRLIDVARNTNAARGLATMLAFLASFAISIGWVAMGATCAWSADIDSKPFCSIMSHGASIALFVLGLTVVPLFACFFCCILSNRY